MVIQISARLFLAILFGMIGRSEAPSVYLCKTVHITATVEQQRKDVQGLCFGQQKWIVQLEDSGDSRSKLDPGKVRRSFYSIKKFKASQYEL